MVDGCNDEIEVFYFPFKEKEPFHDKETKAKSFDTFKDEAIFDEGSVE